MYSHLGRRAESGTDAVCTTARVSVLCLHLCEVLDVSKCPGLCSIGHGISGMPTDGHGPLTSDRCNMTLC